MYNKPQWFRGSMQASQAADPRFEPWHKHTFFFFKKYSNTRNQNNQNLQLYNKLQMRPETRGPT